MLSYFELRKGVFFIYEGKPCQVLDFLQIYKAQDVPSARVKFRDLTSGKVLEKSFHQGQEFEEAEIEKKKVKLLYFKKEKCGFQELDSKNVFEILAEKIGPQIKFLKPGMILEGLKFEGKFINIEVPIKVQLKVVEAPPSLSGERTQGQRKQVTLETGAKIVVPSFVEVGDIVEVNTETEEYVRRISEKENSASD